MAAVDAFSIREVESSASAVKRWGAGIAVAAALHAGAYVYLNRMPAPAGFESQTPIELDLLPPPSGAAQLQEAGADTAADARSEEVTENEPVEELEEISPDDVQPPDPETEAVEALETPQLAMEVPPDLTEAPPDVEAAVTLPPQEMVTAQEEEIEPKPAPKPIAKKPEPKPEKKREVVRERPKPAPKKDAPVAERPAPTQRAQDAGGRSGASANAGAASAAAGAEYARKVQAAVAAQKRSNITFTNRVKVSFTVARSGAVSGVSASEQGPAGAEAMAMVRRANIPPMPADMTASSKRFTVNVNFTSRR